MTATLAPPRRHTLERQEYNPREAYYQSPWKEETVVFGDFHHTVLFIDDDTAVDTTNPDMVALGQALSYVRDIPTRRKLARGLLALKNELDRGAYVVATARRAYMLLLLLMRTFNLPEKYWDHVVTDIALSAIRLEEWARDATKVILFDDTIIRGENYGRNAEYLYSIFGDELECWIFLDWRGTYMVSHLGMDLHYDLAQAFAAQGLLYHADYPRTKTVPLDDVHQFMLAGAEPLEFCEPGASVLDRDWITFDVTNSCMDGLGISNLTLVPTHGLLEKFSALVIKKLGEDLGKQMLNDIVIAKVRVLQTSDLDQDAASFVPVLLVGELSYETMSKSLKKLGLDACVDRNEASMAEIEESETEKIRKRAEEILERLRRTEASLLSYALSVVFMAVMGRSMAKKKLFLSVETKPSTWMDEKTWMKDPATWMEKSDWLLDRQVATTSLGRPLCDAIAGLASWAWKNIDSCDPVFVKDSFQNQLTEEDERSLRLVRRDIVPCPDDQLSKPIYEYIRSINSSADVNHEELSLEKIADVVRCTQLMASMGIDILNDSGLCKPKWEIAGRKDEPKPTVLRYYDRAEATQYVPYMSLPVGSGGGRLGCFAEEPPDSLTNYYREDIDLERRQKV